MTGWARIPPDAAGETLRRALAQDPSGARAFVVHDLQRMRARLADVVAAFPAGALHAVAIKANPLVEVLRQVVATGCGLEAASLEEVHLALAAGCPPDRVVYDSPAKTPDELAVALRLGLYVNADNFAELERIGALRGSVDTRSRVGLRVNPMVGAGSIATTSVAAVGSKFGEPLYEADRVRPELVEAFARWPWLTGLHVHVGSQGCRLEQLWEAAARIRDLRQAVHARVGRPQVEHVDLGGGLPTAYRPDDAPPSVEAWVQGLRERVPELFAPDVTLLTELGRSVQAGCGTAFSRVEYVKAPKLAVIHLGADMFLRRVYAPNDWHHDFSVLDPSGRPKEGPRTPTVIAGPLCFAGDLLARDVLLPPIEPGDWIAVHDVGAYTLSMWSRHCSRGLPLVLGDEGAGAPLVVLKRAETAEDVVRSWSR